MSYEGGRLTPLFDRSRVDRVCRDLAERGGERMTEWTRINTPVGHQQFSADYVPGRLRESIRQKMLVVIPRPRGTIYESGCETNVSYAPFVEDGTGLYGPYRRMYEIRPRNPDGWLSWIDQKTGERRFAKRVLHPGSPGQHMFAIGAHMTEAEFGLFAQRIVQGWARQQERQWEEQVPVFVGTRL